jgi:hypothetical protein
MRQPITFVYRNLVFCDGLDDVWAVYRLPMRSYAGLTTTGKRDVLSQLAALGYGLETDFSLLRVARPWDVRQYLMGVLTTSDVKHKRRQLLDAYLDRHREELGDRTAHTPEVYVSVRLAHARTDSAWSLTQIQSLRSLRSVLGMADGRAVSGRRLNQLMADEEAVSLRILDYVEAEPAATHEIQWLIRRAFFRGLGDPIVDERFLPQALVVEGAGALGASSFKPLEADVLRLVDSPINVESRHLRVETEAGDSHQAFLCLGALPEVAAFPGRQAELLFAPLESLEFPVDAAFSAKLVPNSDAVRLVRRRIVDADNMYDEESHGDHGPSSSTFERPREVRELEQYLTGGDHPPLLRATVSLAVGAPTASLLEERVGRLRREYAAVKLHRPLGAQLDLFISHLPGQRIQPADYDDYLTVEQFGAMVPIATHAVGADVGPCIGYTLSGTRNPVLFDAAEASRSSRAPATLLAGTLGSGKTLCMELIMYQAFLAGSVVCDIDPKGDHALDRLPGIAQELEVIELSADERYRGMLDPLRIAPEETREDIACNFLMSILPEPIAPAWRTEIRLAVQKIVATGGRACAQVIDELKGGSADARAAARSLAVHSASGLAKLGFAQADAEIADGGSRQVTSLRIRNLTLPLPGTARGELTEEERLSRAILHLLAIYALHLTSHDRRRHAVLGFDEAWVLLSDSAGRALLDRISRLGRAQNVTPLLATQMLGDVDELESLIGAAFCFGVEGEREARAVLRLLHLDEDDRALQQQLISFRRGRCLMRDYEGRVSPIQVDLLDPELLSALDTTPRPQGDPRPRASLPAAEFSDTTDQDPDDAAHELDRALM